MVVMDELTLRAQSVIDGEANPLDCWLELKEAESLIKDLQKSIQDRVEEEIDKYPKSRAEYAGNVFSVVSRKNWSYKHSDLWRSINDRKTEIQNAMQQARRANMSLVDEETGEVIPPAEYTLSGYIKMEIQK